MSEALAIVTNYDGLLGALRDRRDQLGVTHLTLDLVSGLQPGYVSKILCDPPIKRLGAMSLGAMLGALGLRLVVEVDPGAHCDQLFTVTLASSVQFGIVRRLVTPWTLRSLGAVSLLGALGLRLVVEEDPEALARVRSRLVKRTRPRRQAEAAPAAISA